MDKLRLVFMGTPELACASLRALTQAPDLEVAAVVTQPDRPKGRDLRLTPPPAKELARGANLPVLQPERARDPALLAELGRLRPDLVTVAAYGQILPQALLDLPRLGCINVHTSLLPKYRGAAPIQWAMLNGDARTGVTIMRMDASLDTGDILAQAATPILEEDDAMTLHDRLAGMGAELLVQTIRRLAADGVRPVPQGADGISYARKIKKEDGRISWDAPARAVWNRVRALLPWPGAWSFLPGAQPRLFKIWQAEPAAEAGRPGEVLRADKAGLVVGCGAGSLRILCVQLEGGRRLGAREFLAGHALAAGQRLE